MAKVEGTGVYERRSQAVLIPAEYRFQSSEVYIRRDPLDGEITLSERPQRRPLQEIFARLDAAGGAAELLRERDMETAEEREWM